MPDAIKSSDDPSEVELTDAPGKEGDLDKTAAKVGGEPFAENAATNQGQVVAAGKVLGQVAKDGAAAQNANELTATMRANGYISVELVPKPADGGVPSQYDAPELIARDPDAPVKNAADDYDSVLVPFKPDGEAAPQSQVSAAANANHQAALDGTNAQQLAAPEYQQRVQNRCLRMTIGLVGGTTALLGTAGGLAYYFLAVYKAGQRAQDATPPASDPTPSPKAPAPPVPAGLQAIAQSPTAIQIMWLLAEGATGYVLKRNGIEIVRTPARQNSFTDTGLTAGTKYCYSVAALNGLVASADAAEVCTLTLDAPPPAPPPPTGLTGLALSATSIRFSWVASQGATSYTVKRRLTTATDFTVLGTVDASKVRLSFDDTGLSEGTQYAYTVSATNAAGTSADAAFIVLATLDACEVLAEQAVAQWNQLDEATYWDQWSNWITTDNPSFDCQWNVAEYSQRIADMSAAPVLNSEALIQAAVDQVLAAYNVAKDTLQIYATLKNLSGPRGAAVHRFEKLNVLARVLASLLAANP